MHAELKDTQQRFTAWLRNPKAGHCPPDVPERRMRAYRELVTNNVESAVSACFPVLQSLVGDARWQNLVMDFFARHRCHSPIYREIPAEFLAWLRQSPPRDLQQELPFLLDLAHYEWMELALDIDPADILEDDIDPAGDLLAGIPVLNPLARVLRYDWPVHRIGPDYMPAAPEPDPTRLVMVRQRNHAIGFLEINPLVERLLLELGSNRAESGQTVLDRLQQEFPDIPEHLFQAGGTHALLELASRDVVLGARTLP